MAAPKECLAVVLDVSESFRPHLEDAVHGLRTLINAKILFSDKDAIGLIAHGTESTDNSLAEQEDHEGQYLHITELNKMAPVNCLTLAALNDLSSRQADVADLVDSLTLGVYAVIQHTAKLKWGKRVLILTDGMSPCTANDEELSTICQEVRRTRATA